MDVTSLIGCIIGLTWCRFSVFKRWNDGVALLDW